MVNAIPVQQQGSRYLREIWLPVLTFRQLNGYVFMLDAQVVKEEGHFPACYTVWISIELDYWSHVLWRQLVLIGGNWQEVLVSPIKDLVEMVQTGS